MRMPDEFTESVMKDFPNFTRKRGLPYSKTGKFLGRKSPAEKKPQGRNTLCACGSGKKFKFCCGKLKEIENENEIRS